MEELSNLFFPMDEEAKSTLEGEGKEEGEHK